MKFLTVYQSLGSLIPIKWNDGLTVTVETDEVEVTLRQVFHNNSPGWIEVTTDTGEEQRFALHELMYAAEFAAEVVKGKSMAELGALAAEKAQEPMKNSTERSIEGPAIEYLDKNDQSSVLSPTITLAAGRIRALGGVVDGRPVTGGEFVMGAYDIGCVLAGATGQYYIFVEACRPLTPQSPSFRF